MQYKNPTTKLIVANSAHQDLGHLGPHPSPSYLWRNSSKSSRYYCKVERYALLSKRYEIMFKVTTLVSRLISEVVTEMMEEEKEILLNHTQI